MVIDVIFFPRSFLYVDPRRYVRRKIDDLTFVAAKP